MQISFLPRIKRRDFTPDSVRVERVEKYFTENNWNLLNEMATVASVHDASVTQIALAWLLANPTITSPIIGANSVAQLMDSLAAVDVTLKPEETALLDSLSA
jgi:aryl-alcohol dehydrogenase-like predicted oxidoreductase